MSESIEKRVELLEKFVLAFTERGTLDLTTEHLDDARFMALFSIVAELAHREGVSIDDFEKHYEERRRYWHDYWLRKAEDVNPERAAAIDLRSIAESDVDLTYPQMFGPPPPEPS